MHHSWHWHWIRNHEGFAKYNGVWLIGVAWHIPASLFCDWLP
jgi:hypothetical protein